VPGLRARLRAYWTYAAAVDGPQVPGRLVDCIGDARRAHRLHCSRPVRTRGYVHCPEECIIKADQNPQLLDALRRLLAAGGEDPDREGLLETPARFLRAWQEWTSGYAENPADILKSFDDGAASYDEMVLVRDIPVYSLCEHHLAPFFGVAHVGYLPQGRIVGLSKLNRLVGAYSRRLQVQERLTTQVADTLFDALKPHGVAVMLECRHMCMESRGVRQPGAATVTSAMRGHFKDDAKSRAEFLSLASRR